MRIAQVSPLYESVPPKLYGGTERIVSYLTEELIKQGHDVTLYASGDSVTKARLVSISDEALRLRRGPFDANALHFLMLEQLSRDVDDGLFDIVHIHVEYWGFPYTKHWTTPHISTVHSRLDMSETKTLFSLYPDVPLVSISKAQQAYLPEQNWISTVHHGLPSEHLAFNAEPRPYLAFLGRISREKRVDRAIEIAKASDMKIKIAAKIDAPDRPYFESEIRHLLDHPLVEYIGEINDAQKAEFLGNAEALLFPVDWPEPFGLVMIEALGCGTPVIGFDRGSVSEVIEHGVTGFVVSDVEEAIQAVARLPTLCRHACRKAFEERFSVERMARNYVAAYTRVCGLRPTANQWKMV